MNRLFLPIRVILGQLRTMPALAAGVVLLVLLFATISWSHIDSIRARIDVVERELIGLEYSQRVRSLVMSIQERRGHLSMLPAVPVAVNLSAVQFARSDIGATIPSILHETGLEARFLELEITEGVVMQGAEAIRSRLDRLHQTGVILSIDDFGTGYSSLSYLKRFPIHKLKIDQSFVRDLTVDDNDAMIVRAIIALGHNLGLRVIAEGVDTAEQLAFLRGEGCEEAQGYLFSSPVPADEMADQLRKGCLTG